MYVGFALRGGCVGGWITNLGLLQIALSRGNHALGFGFSGEGIKGGGREILLDSVS
jgi:hypothetical protein